MTEKSSPVPYYAAMAVREAAQTVLEPAPAGVNVSEWDIKELEAKFPGTIVRMNDKTYVMIPAKRGTRVTNRGKEGETLTLTLLMGSGKSETMTLETLLQSAEAILFGIMSSTDAAAKGVNAAALTVGGIPARVESAGDDGWTGEAGAQTLTRVQLYAAGTAKGTTVDIEAAVASLECGGLPLKWMEVQSPADRAATVAAAQTIAAEKAEMRDTDVPMSALIGNRNTPEGHVIKSRSAQNLK